MQIEASKKKHAECDKNTLTYATIMTQRENEIAATQSILLLDSCERFSSKDREHLLAQLQDTQPDRSRTPESGYAFPHRHPKLTIRGIDQIF